MSRRKIPSREALITALRENDGNMAATGRRFHCDRRTVWQLVNDDPELRQVVDELSETFIDEAENKLFEKIRGGDTACLIFFLKTRAAHRGYSEKFSVTGISLQNIIVELGSGPSIDTIDESPEALNGHGAAVGFLEQ
jgi:hypothetical protein